MGSNTHILRVKVGGKGMLAFGNTANIAVKPHNFHQIIRKLPLLINGVHLFQEAVIHLLRRTDLFHQRNDGAAKLRKECIQGLHVLKVQAAQKKDAIVKVLQTLMQPEVSVKLAKVSGCAPAVESCYTLEEVTSDPLIMAMKQTAETAIPMPNIPEMDVMWTVTGNLLTNVNMSGQDIEPASAAAQKKALELIEAMK